MLIVYRKKVLLYYLSHEDTSAHRLMVFFSQNILLCGNFPDLDHILLPSTAQ